MTTSLDPAAIAQRVSAVADAAVAVARSQHPAPLGPDVTRLSALFTDQRGSRATTYMREPAMRRAYLGFFVPHNVARLSGLLLQAHQEGVLPGAEPRTVLDLGSGPLSGVLASWCVYGALPAATAVDLSRSALDAGLAVLAKVGADPSVVTTLERSISGPTSTWMPKEPVDLVIAANVLNELSDPRDLGPRRRLVSASLAALSPRGRLLLVEPAMRMESRALMALRDDLVADGVGILSPCRGAPGCPLLQTRGDWCHQELRWDLRPAAYVALERDARLPKALLAASHLLLGPPNEPAPRRGLRVVGGLMRGSDGVERRYLCGQQSQLLTAQGNPHLANAVAQAQRGSVTDERAVASSAPAPRAQPFRPQTPGDRGSRTDRGARGRAPPRGDRPKRGR
jgi:hypothetical protein